MGDSEPAAGASEQQIAALREEMRRAGRQLRSSPWRWRPLLALALVLATPAAPSAPLPGTGHDRALLGMFWLWDPIGEQDVTTELKRAGITPFYSMNEPVLLYVSPSDQGRAADTVRRAMHRRFIPIMMLAGAGTPGGVARPPSRWRNRAVREPLLSLKLPPVPTRVARALGAKVAGDPRARGYPDVFRIRIRSRRYVRSGGRRATGYEAALTLGNGATGEVGPVARIQVWDRGRKAVVAGVIDSRAPARSAVTPRG
jgi:hypothetical protein